MLIRTRCGTRGQQSTVTIVRNAVHDWLRKNRPSAVVYIGGLSAVERMDEGGPRVERENSDDTPHSIVETTGRFRSAPLDTGDKLGFTFSRAGIFGYFCSLHPYMIGRS